MESNAIAWSLETTVLPSNLRKGSSTDCEPVAMMMFLVVRTLPSTSTWDAEMILPEPWKVSILLAFIRALMPPRSWSTTWVFLVIKAGTSGARPLTMMPLVAALWEIVW